MFFAFRVCWRSRLASFLICLLPAAVQADLWCTAYYPGWEQGAMPASTIDFTAVTHIIHFSLVPNPDGSLDSSVNGVTAANSADIVSRSHAAGRKVLICVGGANSQTNFQGATLFANRGTFITNLVNFMSGRGYDGIDIDWEPLRDSDIPQYTNFVKGLRSALNAFPPPKLLTVAAAAYPYYGDSPTLQYSMFAGLQPQLDQINIMTYDLSGAYCGWVTWFNAPIYDGGYRFPSTGGLVPSADGSVNNFIAGGVASPKLGIGIAFYGWVWSGGAGTSTGGTALPRQSWTTAPATGQSSFNSIMTTYYQPGLYHWDAAAQAAYLSIDNAGSNNDKFISYDDPRACQSKVSYARNRRLGGVMIWELAQDHHANQADPLLQAVKQAFATPGMTAIQRNGSDIDLSFNTIPLGSYRVQWTTNLSGGLWNTLTVTNISGPGGIVRVTDPGAIGRSPRFYRIQTPP